MAILTGDKGLKEAAESFSCFKKVNESANFDETNKLPGKPEIKFEKWIPSKVYHLEVQYPS